MTDSEDKGGTPSTLEKAVEKAVVHKSKDPKAQGPGTKEGANGETHAAADPPRRSVRRQIIGALSVLLLLAIAYIAWPVWGP